MSRYRAWLPTQWYRLLLAASILLSVGGVILATVFNVTSQGGLGGAFSVALSFAALLVREDLSDRLASIFQRYRKPIDDASVATKQQILEERLNDLETVLWWRGKESRRQNITLAIASVVGTLTWALGEFVSVKLRALF